jgi:hypothetical protein
MALRRGAVQVAVHLRPFEEVAALDHGAERRFGHEPVFAPVLFLAACGARVVCDTDTARCESSSSSAFTRLDLPAPLGAATTKQIAGGFHPPAF